MFLIGDKLVFINRPNFRRVTYFWLCACLKHKCWWMFRVEYWYWRLCWCWCLCIYRTRAGKVGGASASTCAGAGTRAYIVLVLVLELELVLILYVVVVLLLALHWCKFCTGAVGCRSPPMGRNSWWYNLSIDQCGADWGDGKIVHCTLCTWNIGIYKVRQYFLADQEEARGC